MKTKQAVPKMISADEFDKIFDDGEEDIIQYMDLSRAVAVNPEPQRVNVDFPRWMVHALDAEANRLGVTRQSIIKVWIADRLDSCKGAVAASNGKH